MFGKIEWFEPVEDKNFVKPKSWQGYAYFASWAAALIVPMKLLFLIGNTPEAFIWMFFAGFLFAFDYRKVSKTVRQKAEYDKLFFIGEEQKSKSVTTSNYDLKIE